MNATPDDSPRAMPDEKPARRTAKKAAASTPAPDSGPTITTQQMRRMHALLRDHGITGDKAVHDYLSLALSRTVESRTELSPVEAAGIIAELEAAPILHGSVEAALIAFQTEMPVVGKNQTATVPMKQGGSYSYSYADLADVSAAAMPLLTRHGLAFSCCPRSTDRGYELAGVLLHVSGGRIEGALPLHGNTPQDIGSALTYARRYLLGCMTGIVTDNDDDASAAQGAQRTREWDGPSTAQLLRQIEADAVRAGATYEFATAKFRESRGIDIAALDRLNPWEVQSLAEIVKARADEAVAAAAAAPVQDPTPAMVAGHNTATAEPYHGPTTPELLAMIDDHASRAGTTYADITAKWRDEHGGLTVAQLDEQDPRDLAILEASISAYLQDHPPATTSVG